MIEIFKAKMDDILVEDFLDENEENSSSEKDDLKLLLHEANLKVRKG